MYNKELQAIQKSNRFRTREIFDENLIDLASNDYLGLANNKILLEKSFNTLLDEKTHAPKASMLVNGYSKIHKKFENRLCQLNNFENGIVVGSGFLANISLIETLCRKGDMLFIDEQYHASGVLASKLLNKKQVVIFKHNDSVDLEEKLKLHKNAKRKIIAIEGVYSMSGAVASKELFNLANSYECLLVVDEAHSSGVLGDNLLGVFDYYNIKPCKNHIKMGTLGKAYGSYGAYILASKEIISFLENKALPIIYSTAPSVFDIALGLHSLEYIINNKEKLKDRITQNLQIVKDSLNIDSKSLIIPINIGDNKKVKQIQTRLKQKGFLVGAIRQPTVKSAIIRLIAKIDVSKEELKAVCNMITRLKNATNNKECE
ncbi:MAG: aminotransferase class I/II-fold pyridoxal phosphate-dependent enzyme [Campylobacterota bacterium]